MSDDSVPRGYRIPSLKELMPTAGRTSAECSQALRNLIHNAGNQDTAQFVPVALSALLPAIDEADRENVLREVADAFGLDVVRIPDDVSIHQGPWVKKAWWSSIDAIVVCPGWGIKSGVEPA